VEAGAKMSETSTEAIKLAVLGRAIPGGGC